MERSILPKHIVEEILELKHLTTGRERRETKVILVTLAVRTAKPKLHIQHLEVAQGPTAEPETKLAIKIEVQKREEDIQVVIGQIVEKESEEIRKGGKR